MVFGREGAYVLANGKILPTLRARSGAPQRWRIVNAAKSRFFLLDLEGQTVLRDRQRRRPAGTPADDRLAARHAGRASGRHRDADRPSEAGRSRCARTLYNRGYGSVEYPICGDVRRATRMWMFHCHILDHADGGLMGHVHLRPDSSE